MAITEKATMETTVMRSEDGAHRYLLQKVWDKDKKDALLIMLMAGHADTVAIDTTTMLVMKNLKQLDFGGVTICNLFSNLLKESDEENDRIILTAAIKASTIIVAWGTGSVTNPEAQRRIAEILEMMKPYQKNTFCIAAPNGKSGMHPLAPVLRDRWELVPWARPVEAAPKEKEKSPSKKDKKTVPPATPGVQSFTVDKGAGEGGAT